MIIRKSIVVKCFLILVFITSIMIEAKSIERKKKKIICPRGHYYDLESRECKKVPCGGTIIHEDTSLRCTGRFLGIKVHPKYQQYYYICNPSSVVFVKCPENQIFNTTISHCQPSGATSSECKRTGRFPISSNCSLFYICDTDGQKLVRKLMECPKNTVFNPKTQRCSCVHQCTPTEIDPDDFFEDYDEEIFPPCTRPGRFRSPTDCSFYYTCSSKTNGKFYQTRYRCPVGTYYDIQREKCRNERRVKCDLMTVEELIEEYERTHNYNESDVSEESAEISPIESTTVISLTTSDLHLPDNVSTANVPAGKPSTDFRQYEGNDEDYGNPSEYYPEIDSEYKNSKPVTTTAKYEDIEPFNTEVEKSTTGHDSIFSNTESPEGIVHITSTVTSASTIEEPVKESVEVSPTTSATLNHVDMTSALPNSITTISHFVESSLEEDDTYNTHSQKNEEEETFQSTLNTQPISTPLYSDIVDKKTSTPSLVDETSGNMGGFSTTSSHEAENDSKTTDEPHSSDEAITIAPELTQKPVISTTPLDITTSYPYNKPEESDDSGRTVDSDSSLPSFDVNETPMSIKSPKTTEVSSEYDVTTPEKTVSVTTPESKWETTTPPLKNYTIAETQHTEAFEVDTKLTATKSPDFQVDEIFTSTLTQQQTTLPTNIELSTKMIEDSSKSTPLIENGVTDTEELNEDVVRTTSEEEKVTTEKTIHEASEFPTTSVPVDPHDISSSSEVEHDLDEFSLLIDKTTINKEFAESTTINPFELMKNSSNPEEYQISEEVIGNTDQPETVTRSILYKDPEILTTLKYVTEIVHETPFEKTTTIEPLTLSTEIAKTDKNTNDDDIKTTESIISQYTVELTSEHPITNIEKQEQLTTVENFAPTENAVSYEGPVTQQSRISTVDAHATHSLDGSIHSTVTPEDESLPQNEQNTKNTYPQSDSLISTNSSPEFQVSTESSEIKQPTDQPTKDDWTEPTKNTDSSSPTEPTVISETTISVDTTELTNEKEVQIGSGETRFESTTINYEKTHSSTTTAIKLVQSTEPIVPMNYPTTIRPTKETSENIVDAVENQTNVSETPLNWPVESSSLLPEDGLDQIKSDLQTSEENQTTEESQTSFPTSQHEMYTPEYKLEFTLNPLRPAENSDPSGENDLETEISTTKETATPLPALVEPNGISTLKPPEKYSGNQSNEQRSSAATEKGTSSPPDYTETPIEIDTLTSSKVPTEDLISMTSTTAVPNGEPEVVSIDKTSPKESDETPSPGPFTDSPVSENNISTAAEGESNEDYTSGIFSSEIYQETASTDQLAESLSSATESSPRSPPQEIDITDSIPSNTPISSTTERPLDISCTKFDKANMTALHLEDKSVEILDVHISKPLKLLLHFHPKFSCDDCDKSKKGDLKVRESDQKELKTLYLTF